jgi:N-acetylglucosamine-6-sulfatase
VGHDHDEPRPGFDHWCSFRGQGTYRDPVLNINGTRQAFKGYTADVITTQALDWLEQLDRARPFFLMLSFKSVHYPFQPAARNRGRYRDAKIEYPETMANSEENYRAQPRWVRERRYSIHGIDHMQTGPFDKDPVPSLDQLYRDYAATVYGMDENIGRILDFLDQKQLNDQTFVLYMGDNGFALGEHGFYDKRDAFETSIRIPMLAYAPGLIDAGTSVDAMVLNIDVAPTLLELAQAKIQDKAKLDGDSFLAWLKGEQKPWRDHMLYEYHWEWNFPATPTLFALRTDRYKYIYHYGVWDHDGLYDLQTDPHERHNLINVPAYRDRAVAMRQRLFDELESRDALRLPLRRPAGERLDDRKLHR